MNLPAEPARCIDPPHELTTTATRDSVSVCWNHDADGCDPAAGFDVSWITGGGEGGGVSVVGTDGGCHTISQLEPGTCLTVNVVAVSARDTEPRSDPAKAKACTTAGPGPAVPPVLEQCRGCRPWPIDPTCCDGWPGEDENDPVILARAEAAARIASDRLRKLTAGRYGLCEELVRPCRDVCRVRWDERWGRYLNPPYPYPGAGDGILRPYLKAGLMYNLCRGGCSQDCACDDVCKVTLPGPVHEILAVYVDGQLLPADSYLVTEPPDNWLIRLDGECWPDCQSMTSSLTELGTFAVRYLKGRDPACDPDALRAVSALACELFKKACGAKCRLPGRIRTLSRDGITYEVLEGWPRVGTGLDEVDDWLGLVNPHQLRAPAAVFTLDMPSSRFHGRGGAF